MDTNFIVVSKRQIKSKSKRIQKRANKTKEQIVKKQLNKHLLNIDKRKTLTKRERLRLVDELSANNSYKHDFVLNDDVLIKEINGVDIVHQLHSFLDNIISQVNRHVHNYEQLIHQYQSTFLININNYHWSIEKYDTLFPMLDNYLNELQSSKYGQNYNIAAQRTNSYNVLDTLRDKLMETLEEIEHDDTPKYVLEHIKRLFENEAKDVFYASKQIRQEKLEEIYGLGQKVQIDKLHEMLGINI